MTHLLVANDFPPKIGGIQSYLGELWRRLPPESTVVLTTRSSDPTFDSRQRYRIERSPDPVLLPTPALARRVRSLACEVGARLVLLDPVFPLGLLGPRLGYPYALVVHGAELVVPARLPGLAAVLRPVVSQAEGVVAGGRYCEDEIRRLGAGPRRMAVIPPGVDVERFRPRGEDERRRVRGQLGLDPEGRLVLSVTRLVPRKGLDALIGATALLAPDRPDLTLAIAGQGRDRRRLEWLAKRADAPVRFVGVVADEQLPALYGSADVFAMPCRRRWGGLEQEGFGIVFLEAAASGVPQVAGDSGGATEAVADGETGVVVRRPRDRWAVAAALAPLLDRPELRARQGAASRRRVETEFTYDLLARRLAAVLDEWARAR